MTHVLLPLWEMAFSWFPLLFILLYVLHPSMDWVLAPLPPVFCALICGVDDCYTRHWSNTDIHVGCYRRCVWLHWNYTSPISDTLCTMSSLFNGFDLSFFYIPSLQARLRHTEHNGVKDKPCTIQVTREPMASFSPLLNHTSG